VRRLAIFWLFCAAAGFTVAAMAAFVLSLTLDHEAVWRATPPPAPVARFLEELQAPSRPSERVSPG
jgi:hypothetical protein